MFPDIRRAPLRTPPGDHIWRVGHRRGDAARALAVFGCDFLQAFGQTESSGCPHDARPRRAPPCAGGEGQLLLSCGKALPGTEIAVVDPSGKPVETGEVGEIIARGPQVMRGYWRLAEATAAPWSAAGSTPATRAPRRRGLSVHLRPAEGHDRLRRREHLSPGDRRRHLPAARRGRRRRDRCPADQWGETVKAIVVPKPGVNLTEEPVIAWCSDRQPDTSAPSRWTSWASCPGTQPGRFSRRCCVSRTGRDALAGWADRRGDGSCWPAHLRRPG